MENSTRLMSVIEALRLVKPGSRVFLGIGCGAPRALLTALEDAVPRVPDLKFVSFITSDALSRAADGTPKTRYRHRVFFVGNDVVGLAGTDRLHYVPISGSTGGTTRRHWPNSSCEPRNCRRAWSP